ncbi:MAG: alpha/beta family hydrolase [Bacteroidia bacterium]|nr:alpha/beta family hydrolase [Bacteroidia bacterium]
MAETRWEDRLVLPDQSSTLALWQVPEVPRAVMALGHGAGTDITHPVMESLTTVLTQAGVGVLRYRFPFRERGGGRDREVVSLRTVAAAVQQAAARYPALPCLAGGHSFGGRMTSLAAAAGNLSAVSGLILFAFPLHAPGSPGVTRAAHLDRVAVPMLFVSGTRDTFAREDLLSGVIDALGDRATRCRLDTVTHGYTAARNTQLPGGDVFAAIRQAVDVWLTDLLPSA